MGVLDLPLTTRLRALARAPGGIAALALPLLTGVGAAFAPLADHLGFELALALTIVSVFSATAAGMAAARLERARAPQERRPGLAALAAMLLSTLALLAPVLVILANALRRPACDNPGGLAWLLVLPVPGAWLAAATGAFARLRAPGRLGATLLAGGLMAASLGTGLASLYSGPAFFLYDHFFGYFPGPLYDEVVAIHPTVLAFRALTVLWALAAWLGCAAHGEGAGARRAGAAGALLAGALLATSLLWGAQLGFRTTDRSLAQALGGLRREGALEIRHPKEWPEKTIRQFASDAAFRAAQVREALGVPDEPVRIWVYRSADEKRRLAGAAATSFAKPWRREIHIHAGAFPHGVLRHELVHAYAASLAPGPFHVPGGLVPNSPLIEGFAVAMDAEPEGLTLAQRARAMRDLKLAPDLQALLSVRGFFASAQARAYGYAGAFLQDLARRHGREKVKELYATGDLSRLGEPAKLISEFEQTLDATKVSEDERAWAQRRYARPSVFHRRCAREVAALADRARELAAAGDTQAAIAAGEEACRLEPDDPALARSLVSVALKAGDAGRARAAAERVLAHPKSDPVLRAETLVELGDAAWKDGRTDEARESYRRSASLPADEATLRGVAARLRALEDPERAAVVQPLLAEAKTDLAQLFRLSDRLQARPDDALVAYLLGRQLAQRDAPEKGAELLARAQGGLGDAGLEKESLRLRVRTLAVLRRCDEAAGARGALRAAGGGDADDANAADWIERCRFEAAREAAAKR